jgi:hypothetical protein
MFIRIFLIPIYTYSNNYLDNIILPNFAYYNTSIPTFEIWIHFFTLLPNHRQELFIFLLFPLMSSFSFVLVFGIFMCIENKKRIENCTLTLRFCLDLFRIDRITADYTNYKHNLWYLVLLNKNASLWCYLQP